MRKLGFGLLLCLIMLGCASVSKNTIVLQEQGSFTVGGTVITEPGEYDPYGFNNWIPVTPGQSLHGDHAYVFYQIPADRRKLPLVFLHGIGQSAKTWESTPDGRDGFQNIFLRRGFSVYLVDQPRRGKAGLSTSPAVIEPLPEDQWWFGNFRLGRWPEYYEGVQFPRDAESLNQFLRQMTPNIGNLDIAVINDAMSELFDKIGGGIFVTHSAGGPIGWFVAMENKNVQAIVAFEPGICVFPEGENPPAMPSAVGDVQGISVPLDDFLQLTKIPIIIYFGDYIPEEPTQNLGGDNWRTRRDNARDFVEAVNRHGGNAIIVELPKIGIYGNTHFPMSDLNNVEIADHLSRWLAEKGLDE